MRLRPYETVAVAATRCYHTNESYSADAIPAGTITERIADSINKKSVLYAIAEYCRRCCDIRLSGVCSRLSRARGSSNGDDGVGGSVGALLEGRARS